MPSAKQIRVIPANAQAAFQLPPEHHNLCYVMLQATTQDWELLAKLCRHHGLVDPLLPLSNGAARTLSCSDLSQLARQLMVLPADSIIMPVVMLWGPDHKPCHNSWWNRWRHGQHLRVRLALPIALSELKHGHPQQLDRAKLLARATRWHGFRVRQTVAGTALPQRAQLIQRLCQGRHSRSYRFGQSEFADTVQQQQAIFNEMAASPQSWLIRLGDPLLRAIWHRLYDGIDIHGDEQLRQLSDQGYTLVFLPCHRSHMDYLLLTYVLYQLGISLPQIAAGINLNFFPAGGLFRRGGAFFIRRSIKGDAAYSNALRDYVEWLVDEGHNLEFYPEGGRSRNGQLLPPKTGLLAMVQQAQQVMLHRRIAYVPVSLNYDHVMEVATYQRELSGASKQKESAWVVLSMLKNLRRLGQAHIRFAAPILSDYNLDAQQLGEQALYAINRETAVSATTLLALAFSCLQQEQLEITTLNQQLQQLLQCARQNWPERQALFADAPQHYIEQALRLRSWQQNGQQIHASFAQQLPYYRNCIGHWWLVPALRQCFSSQDRTHSQLCYQLFAPLYYWPGTAQQWQQQWQMSSSVAGIEQLVLPYLRFIADVLSGQDFNQAQQHALYRGGDDGWLDKRHLQPLHQQLLALNDDELQTLTSALNALHTRISDQ